MGERWSEPDGRSAWGQDEPRRGRAAERFPAGEGLDQGLDRLVSAGRQLVDGVSGARPGSRGSARASSRGPAPRPRINDIGRWVEQKLDWILDDEDDWREPWQQPSPQQSPEALGNQGRREPPAPPSRRRPLEAISRRPAVAPAAAPGASPAGENDWPDAEDFTLPRWQRGKAGMTPSEQSSPPVRGPGNGAGRALPRSSRRRQG